MPGARKAWRTAGTDGRTTTERGYGWRWRQLRELVLERDRYLCQCDRCKGGALRLTVASEVDHITPKAKGGTDAMENLQAISTECHERKTAEENGRAHRPTIGPDGYPIGPDAPVAVRPRAGARR